MKSIQISEKKSVIFNELCVRYSEKKDLRNYLYQIDNFFISVAYFWIKLISFDKLKISDQERNLQTKLLS